MCLFLLGSISAGSRVKFEEPNSILLLIVVLILFSLLRLAGSRSSFSMIVLSHKGVQFGEIGAKARKISWAVFERAYCYRLLGVVVVRDKKGKAVFRYGWQRFGGRARARECVQEINEAAEVYSVSLR